MSEKGILWHVYNSGNYNIAKETGIQVHKIPKTLK